MHKSHRQGREIKAPDLKSQAAVKGSVRLDHIVALEVWGMAEAAVGQGEGVSMWSSGGGIQSRSFMAMSRSTSGTTRSVAHLIPRTHIVEKLPKRRAPSLTPSG